MIDIRPIEQRARDGDLPGAVVVDRNVLEWRLDPTSADRLPVAADADVALHRRVQPGLQLQFAARLRSASWGCTGRQTSSEASKHGPRTWLRTSRSGRAAAAVPPRLRRRNSRRRRSGVPATPLNSTSAVGQPLT